MNILLWVLQVLAALLYGASSVMKVFMFDKVSKDVPSFGALPREAWTPRCMPGRSTAAASFVSAVGSREIGFSKISGQISGIGRRNASSVQVASGLTPGEKVALKDPTEAASQKK